MHTFPRDQLNFGREIAPSANVFLGSLWSGFDPAEAGVLFNFDEALWLRIDGHSSRNGLGLGLGLGL